MENNVLALSEEIWYYFWIFEFQSCLKAVLQSFFFLTNVNSALSPAITLSITACEQSRTLAKIPQATMKAEAITIIVINNSNNNNNNNLYSTV